MVVDISPANTGRWARPAAISIDSPAMYLMDVGVYAERVVHFIQCPRWGTQGVGPGRAKHHAMDAPREYFARAKRDILMTLMIEEPEVVEGIDESLR